MAALNMKLTPPRAQLWHRYVYAKRTASSDTSGDTQGLDAGR